ncbi:MAG TPA: nucleoside-diphosphate sugar epimerase/dehydratase [Gemmatimonadaceae bacterium]
MSTRADAVGAPRSAIQRLERRVPVMIVRHRRLLVLLAHAAITMVAYRVAFALRFDGLVPAEAVRAFWQSLPMLLVIRLAAVAQFGLHRGYWRHVGQQDLIDLTLATTAGTVCFAAAVALSGAVGEIPRSVLLLEWMVTLLLSGGTRFVVRAAREGRLSRVTSDPTRAVIVGAGAAGERLIRQLGHDGTRAVRAVALLDDDPAKRHMSLHGVPVVGTVDELDASVRRHQATLVVIAAPSATPEQMRRIVDRCLKAKVEFKRLPALGEVLHGGNGTTARRAVLADVELEHLLVRDPVVFDPTPVARDFGGSVVLITGGAGSVGAELARQIARVGPSRLVLLDQAESPLYFVHLELLRAHPELEVVPVVADVGNRDAIAGVFERHRPRHVFHAAAYKHVPMMEAHPAEAVRNNVLGTIHVAECAVEHEAQRFVLISTDKAVRPSSVMGATKRVAERIVLGWPALRESATDFRAVRFGNVLGSDGSVVPLFRRQLASGGPITVTDPEVRRYFMTLPEAAQLVLQAASIPEAASRIVMLEMGEQVRILDLAENLIRLSGLEPYRDVQIVFTGLRPGEKLHEELMSTTECTVPSGVEKIHIVQTDEVDGASVRAQVERLCAAAARGDRTGVLLALRQLVPEGVPALGAVVGGPQVPATAVPSWGWRSSSGMAARSPRHP